jgi:hypothetical protein
MGCAARPATTGAAPGWRVTRPTRASSATRRASINPTSASCGTCPTATARWRCRRCRRGAHCRAVRGCWGGGGLGKRGGGERLCFGAGGVVECVCCGCGLVQRRRTFRVLVRFVGLRLRDRVNRAGNFVRHLRCGVPNLLVVARATPFRPVRITRHLALLQLVALWPMCTASCGASAPGIEPRLFYQRP